jgi:hypothetical protein
LSSTVSEAGTNFTSDERLRQSFYNRVDYVADRIADESEIRRGKQFPYQYFPRHPMLVSATVTAKCVLENVEVVCPHEIPFSSSSS